jgi:subtilase family serine protease
MAVALVCGLLLMTLPKAASSQSDGPVAITSRAGSDKASGLVRLAGNTRPEVSAAVDRTVVGRAAVDLGAVDDGLPLEHLLLLLKPAPERELALAVYLESLHDPASENYHRWLTAEEFGSRFGLTAAELEPIQEWLAGQGLRVGVTYPNRLMIDFSGTAGQIREAFHTEIHRYEVDGVQHVANASDPAVPGVLAGRVEGIVSLHDFRPRPLHGLAMSRDFSAGSGVTEERLVTPPDLATIYNLTPLFKAGYTGKGQTIAVVANSDVYSSADWVEFRSAFGLSGYTTGSLSQTHPAAKGGESCADPGVIPGWDEEPILDAEYATAGAPGAVVEVASCKNSGATAGAVLSLMNLVNGETLPTVISVSVGECEAANGATANAAILKAFEQAAAEGISVFSASGDGGAAFCDTGGTVAVHGLGVNAYASTPYNVAVGGTDFSDVYSGTTNTYWNATNTSTEGSARSYVPEAPWNDSCASPLIAGWNGYKVTEGALGFCAKDFVTMDAYQTVTAGGGGPSNCATGTALLSFEVSGTCRGYAKPSWQSVTGNPKDAVRDLPDVALFAGDGIWGHAYVYCNSNPSDYDSEPCKSTEVATWSRSGGTSFAAPVMAGIQALVTQKWGKQGNPNPVYYKLATAQFASSTLKTACTSTEGVDSSASCVFHDVNQGGIAVNCEGLLDCFGNVLSTSSLSFAAAYSAAAGWDFGSGLGSVNAYNLVMSTGW